MNKTNFIHQLIARHYMISVAALTGPSRRRQVVLPRRIAMYLERTILRHSYPLIARNFHRNHATVITGIAVLAYNFDRNAILKKQIEEYVNECAVAFGLTEPAQ